MTPCSNHTTWEEGVRRSTVNPEIFTRILFSGLSLKGILVTVKNWRLGHDLPISVNDSDFPISRGF